MAKGEGQVNALVILLTGLGLWGIGRQRDVAGGLAAGIGATLKLFPLVLLPPAIVARRWHFVLSFVGAFIAIWLVSLYLHLGLGLGKSAQGVLWFVNSAIGEGGRDQSPVSMLLWRARFAAPGAAALLGLLALYRRDNPALVASVGAIWVAWGGTALAGSRAMHEGLLIVPALAWIIAWPFQQRYRVLAISVVVALLAFVLANGLERTHVRDTLRWVDFGFCITLAAVLRALAERRAGPTLRPGEAGAS